MTVMDNLHRKGWLERRRDGRAWRYEPVLTRQAYTARLMHEALAVSDDRAGVLARFVAEIDPADAAALAAALAEAPEDGPGRGRRDDRRRRADPLRDGGRAGRSGGLPPRALAAARTAAGGGGGARRGLVGARGARPGRNDDHPPAERRCSPTSDGWSAPA